MTKALFIGRFQEPWSKLAMNFNCRANDLTRKVVHGKISRRDTKPKTALSLRLRACAVRSISYLLIAFPTPSNCPAEPSIVFLWTM